MSLVDKDYMKSLFSLLTDRLDSSVIYQYSFVYDDEASEYRDAVCATFYSTKDLGTADNNVIKDNQKKLDALNYLESRGAYITATGVRWDTSSTFYEIIDCYAKNGYLYFRGFDRSITNGSSSTTPKEFDVAYNVSYLSLLKSEYKVETTIST